MIYYQVSNEYDGVSLEALELEHMKISMELHSRYLKMRKEGTPPSLAPIAENFQTTYLAVRIRENINPKFPWEASNTRDLRRAIHTHANMRGHHIADMPLSMSRRLYPFSAVNLSDHYESMNILFTNLDTLGTI